MIKELVFGLLANITPITIENGHMVVLENGQLVAYSMTLDHYDLSKLQSRAAELVQGGDPPATLAECENACKMYNNVLCTWHLTWYPSDVDGEIYPLLEGWCEWVPAPLNYCKTERECDFIPTITFNVKNNAEVWEKDPVDHQWYLIYTNFTGAAVLKTFTMRHVDECGADFEHEYLVQDYFTGADLAMFWARYGCTRCE